MRENWEWKQISEKRESGENNWFCRENEVDSEESRDNIEKSLEKDKKVGR